MRPSARSLLGVLCTPGAASSFSWGERPVAPRGRDPLCYYCRSLSFCPLSARVWSLPLLCLSPFREAACARLRCPDLAVGPPESVPAPLAATRPVAPLYLCSTLAHSPGDLPLLSYPCTSYFSRSCQLLCLATLLRRLPAYWTLTLAVGRQPSRRRGPLLLLFFCHLVPTPPGESCWGSGWGPGGNPCPLRRTGRVYRAPAAQPVNLPSRSGSLLPFPNSE